MSHDDDPNPFTTNGMESLATTDFALYWRMFRLCSGMAVVVGVVLVDQFPPRHERDAED
jgi:hypothetical protein